MDESIRPFLYHKIDFITIAASFFVVAFILSLVSSILIRFIYNKYNNIKLTSSYSGAYAAETILRNSGLDNIKVEVTDDYLGDHYDSKNKKVLLSEGNFNGKTISALGISAHECGHAIHHSMYPNLYKFSLFIPVMNNYGSKVILAIMLLGLFSQLSIFGMSFLMLGLVLFIFLMLVTLLNFPLEIIASKLALKNLKENNLIPVEKEEGVIKVLRIASLVYFTSIFLQIFQLLKFLFSEKKDRSAVKDN
ncbi:zinc metallopeptidase [candidate division KSB1 bacterium]